MGRMFYGVMAALVAVSFAMASGVSLDTAWVIGFLSYLASTETFDHLPRLDE